MVAFITTSLTSLERRLNALAPLECVAYARTTDANAAFRSDETYGPYQIPALSEIAKIIPQMI
jgi:hypothetical protein